MINYLYINNKKVAVSHEVYTALKKIDNRERYLLRTSIAKGLIHIDSYDTEDINAVDLIRSEELSAYHLLEDEDITTAIYKALDTLSKDEREIIHLLFFEGYTLDNVAVSKGTNAMNIMRRRDKILKKLRIFLKNYKNFVIEE